MSVRCSGNPNIEFFTSEESMEGFEQVRQWLDFFCTKHIRSNPPTTRPTKESLSQLLISFMKFQEKRFGRFASKPPIMRVPMRCFLDFRPGGGLCHIFSNIYRYKFEHKWTKFEFDMTDKALNDEDPYMQMCREVYEGLIHQKCFRLPTAYIQAEVDEDSRKRITGILKDRQCEITEDQDQASHIIYPESISTSGAIEDYARVSFKRGSRVMMHWYFCPESYDSWLPNRYILADDIPESINSPLKTWYVSANWVFESEDYNEWMLEDDFEVDENGKRLVHRHRMTVEDFFQENISSPATSKPNIEQKRSRSSSSTSTSAKKMKSDESKIVVKHERLLPTVDCVDCGKRIAAKGMQRHRKEQHSSESLKCNLCSFTTKREATLKDHNRRKHCEPVPMGRPKKNEKPRRKRSPFRIDTFEARHKTSLETNAVLKEALQANTEKMNAVSIVMEKIAANAQIDNQKNEERLKTLESTKQFNDIEIHKMKTRVTMIESKQQANLIPDARDVHAVFEYFNLNVDSTKEDIRKTINLRSMEVSSESLISEEIFSTKKMSTEEREKIILFCNEALTNLLNWKKQQECLN